MVHLGLKRVVEVGGRSGSRGGVIEQIKAKALHKNVFNLYQQYLLMGNEPD